ncbi:MAG: methylated-DNA--[protein]-cysteine S-methyltransferase [Synechococcaceae cyanobacterium SM2_3_2]|nr:methylated-DNA--[protein]-cysteine S-methyltransferase [Synechococcaceae cyanobacterium SM2_3_2]
MSLALDTPRPAGTTYAGTTYECMAQAITFMRQNHLHQPDLATIAQHVDLSEHHFQRVFAHWAGINPKRFWPYLTVTYAKEKIAETKSLMALSAEGGSSSPGRLHDLSVTVEAMSPGECKTKGSGLTIEYGIHATPLGDCLIATTARGVCKLDFGDPVHPGAAQHHLREEWPQAEIVHNQQATQAISDRILQPLATQLDPLVLWVKGTNFQIQVWRALLNLPFGGLTTYQDLAIVMGRPSAARAVGTALGRNPVGYFIPCHRVIRASGELGGFRWGVERKSVLLGWEASHSQLRADGRTDGAGGIP